MNGAWSTVQRVNNYVSMYSGPLFQSFTFHGFSYLQSIILQKYNVENSRNKQFLSFKLRAILSSMMKSHTVVPIIPLSCVSTWYMLPACQSLISCLGYHITVTLLQILCSSILLSNGPNTQEQWCWPFRYTKEKL